jgi:hypothetical protein
VEDELSSLKAIIEVQMREDDEAYPKAYSSMNMSVGMWLLIVKSSLEGC